MHVVVQDYLVKWPKTLMVVSHARDFLNMVCTDILHLHSRKLTSYKGDFDTFERTASDRLRNAKKAAEGHERQRAHMQVRLAAVLQLGLVCMGVHIANLTKCGSQEFCSSCCAPICGTVCSIHAKTNSTFEPPFALTEWCLLEFAEHVLPLLISSHVLPPL